MPSKRQKARNRDSEEERRKHLVKNIIWPGVERNNEVPYCVG